MRKTRWKRLSKQRKRLLDEMGRIIGTTNVESGEPPEKVTSGEALRRLQGYAAERRK